MRVPVIEGEIGYPADSERSFSLRNIEVPLLSRGRDAARNKIEVRFRYSESGILRFTVTHAATGKLLAEREIDSFGPDGTPLQHGLEDELTRLLARSQTVPPLSGTFRRPRWRTPALRRSSLRARRGDRPRGDGQRGTAGRWREGSDPLRVEASHQVYDGHGLMVGALVTPSWHTRPAEWARPEPRPLPPSPILRKWAN
ncbi:hypothetical protein [Streptomyces sp. NPDC059805]|uniref:hypothetical protein n=1 Tax=Streptomyces sp. NPDC059805 TaxID=3346954 RepID=UPI0036694C69